MRPFLYFAAGTIALSCVLVVAFGTGALWLYGFFVLVAAATAVGVGTGGELVTEWSRRRFDER
jgi:hypothetical protein